MSELWAVEALKENEVLKHKLKLANQALAEELQTNQVLRGQLEVVKADGNNVWYWQPYNNEPENLTCPVVMEADTLRQFLVDQTSLDYARSRIDELLDENSLLQNDIKELEIDHTSLLVDHNYMLSELEEAKQLINDLEDRLNKYE